MAKNYCTKVTNVSGLELESILQYFSNIIVNRTWLLRLLPLLKLYDI